jgi:hypothetical protein
VTEFKGFHAPYNPLFWALVHIGMPFNLECPRVQQGKGRSSDDFVVQHPHVMADGENYQQYQSKPVPHPPVIA